MTFSLHSFFSSNAGLSFLITVFATFIIGKAVSIIFNFQKKKKGIGNMTQFNFMMHFLIGTIYILGIGTALSFIPSFKSLSSSLLASSGILAVSVGFASQQALSNIVGGVFIVLFKPFNLGDTIQIADKNIVGTVEDITLRHTIIKNFENKRVIIPNSVISSSVIENANIIESKVCKFFEIPISFDSDIDKAFEIIRSEAENHPDIFDNRSEEDIQNNKPKVNVQVVGFGESSLNLKAWLWAKDNATGVRMIWNLNYIIKKRFDAENVVIPYPHRTIISKKEV